MSEKIEAIDLSENNLSEQIWGYEASSSIDMPLSACNDRPLFRGSFAEPVPKPLTLVPFEGPTVVPRTGT
ncbi:hypothetical protein LguiA_021852 [Lonicera macranthoides]